MDDCCWSLGSLSLYRFLQPWPLLGSNLLESFLIWGVLELLVLMLGGRFEFFPSCFLLVVYLYLLTNYLFNNVNGFIVDLIMRSTR